MLDPDRNDRAALEVRRDALQLLLEQAENRIRNSNEIGWLKYRLRDTEAKPGTGPVG